jgi:hypothetical protein
MNLEYPSVLLLLEIITEQENIVSRSFSLLREIPPFNFIDGYVKQSRRMLFSVYELFKLFMNRYGGLNLPELVHCSQLSLMQDLLLTTLACNN